MNSARTEHGLRDVYRGVLLGTAVGDALGLPAENLSPESIQRRWKGEWRMRLVFGHGMISDDTERTLLVAQALLSHPRDGSRTDWPNNKSLKPPWDQRPASGPD